MKWDFFRRNKIEDSLEAYRYIASILRLKDSYLLTKYDDFKIHRICNGIGPEWFPEKLRKLVDRIHPSIVIPAWIHDLRYYDGDGTDSDFHEANRNFFYNCEDVIDFFYSKRNICRWFARRSAKKFYKMCEKFGHVAYMNAIAERQSDEVEKKK